MAQGIKEDDLWESQKHHQHSVDGLFVTMFGLRLQPQQQRCLHLGLITRGLTMYRPQLGRGVIIMMNVKLCRFKVFSTDSLIDTLHHIETIDLVTEEIQEYPLNDESCVRSN